MIKKLKTTTKKSKPVTPINIDLTGKIINNVRSLKKTRIDVFAAVAVVDAKAPYLLDASGVASLRFVNGCCHFQPPINGLLFLNRTVLCFISKVKKKNPTANTDH